MIRGKIGGDNKRLRLTVPTVYIDTKILYKGEEEDKEVMQVIHDLWDSYAVNIRLLHVVSDTLAIFDENEELVGIEKDLSINLKQETTTESMLLGHIQPSSVACFFGRKDVLPSNHKVYSRDEFVNNYHIILSNTRMDVHTTRDKTRFHRRRG